MYPFETLFQSESEEYLVELSSSSQPKICQLIESRSNNESIDWESRIREAVSKAPDLHWIKDLQQLELNDQELSNFFKTIESISFCDPIAKKNISLFREAKKALKDLQIACTSLFKASYLLFSLEKELLNDPQFALNSFLVTLSEVVSESEEACLHFVICYIKNCTSIDYPDRRHVLKAAIKALSWLEYDWLSHFLGECNQNICLRFVSACKELVESKELSSHLFSSTVYQRMCQILQIENITSFLLGKISEKAGYTPTLSAMRLAHEIVKKQPSDLAPIKVPIKSEGFPHIELHYDLVSGDLYMFSTITWEYTTHVRVRLPSICTQPPTTSISLKVDTTGRKLIESRQAAQMHRYLTGNRGIWPLLSTFFYEKPEPQFLVFTPPSINLGNVIEKKESLTLIQLLSIFEDLAYGLDHMHANKLIHGNINLQNAVLSEDPSKRSEVGWTGFTCTRRPTENLADGDSYKDDIWAFGKVCVDLLTKLSVVGLSEEFLKILNREIALSPVLLQEKKDLSIEEALYLLVHNMTHINEKLRPSSTDVKAAIVTIGQRLKS